MPFCFFHSIKHNNHVDRNDIPMSQKTMIISFFTYMLYFLIHCQYFTGLSYIWVQLGMLNKKQKCLEQRQANENKNTENWKMSMDTIEKTGLTQVLANVGHNRCFTSTFLDICCLIFLFKHSINYEINKIRKGKNTVWLRVY